MNTKLLLVFAAIAALAGTVTMVAIPSADASSYVNLDGFTADDINSNNDQGNENLDEAGSRGGDLDAEDIQTDQPTR